MSSISSRLRRPRTVILLALLTTGVFATDRDTLEAAIKAALKP